MTSGLFTVLAFTGFILIGIWAYSRHNRARFDEASRLPLEDETPNAAGACCCGNRKKDGGGCA